MISLIRKKIVKKTDKSCFSIIRTGNMDLSINIGFSLARELVDILLNQEEGIDPSLYAFARQLQTEMKTLSSNRIEIDQNAVHFMVNPYSLVLEVNKVFALNLANLLLEQVEDVKPYVIAFAGQIKSLATIRKRIVKESNFG